MSARSARESTRRIATAAGTRRCKECLPGSRRKAKYPGPRCWTHHRARRRGLSEARKAKRLEDTYDITEEDYQALLKAQGGVCYICRKRPGKKRLSVDHDHALAALHDHPKDKGCKGCIRGLLHSKCNSFLGWVRDDPAAMERGADYLRNPPARTVLI